MKPINTPARYFCFRVLLVLVSLNTATSSFANEITSRIDNDIPALLKTRVGLQKTISYMQARPDLFPSGTDSIKDLGREQREQVWQIWQRFQDYVLALNSLASYYNEVDVTDQDSRPFKLSIAAYLAVYRYAMEFVAIANSRPELDKVLNEEVPELGLPANTYRKMKFSYLNVFQGAEFSLMNIREAASKSSSNHQLQQVIDDDIKAIWKTGLNGEGPTNTAKNGIQIIRDSIQEIWFPVQKGVSEWMGDVKVKRLHQYLISYQQIADLETHLQPGDILLERREWYLSNIGLPGYWPHAALYIGSVEQRMQYFDDAEIREWIQHNEPQTKGYEDFLRKTNPDAYQASQVKDSSGHVARVIEAVSEGVIFTTLEYSAKADSLVVLRPKVSKREKAIAIKRAFHYSGRPYDFDFDFLTDASLVCSELVYKAYEKGGEMTQGLSLPLVEILGRKTMPANKIAEVYAVNKREKQQLEFVEFLDGDEFGGKAYVSTESEFLKSWKRPKWHIFLQ